MKNEIYLTMGALVERRNNFDSDEVKRTIPRLQDEGYIDGCEFMFIRTYYECDRGVELARELTAEGCRFPTFHTDKDIGAILSDAGIAYFKDNDKNAAFMKKLEALSLFEYNCETACEAGAKRLVLHLWGGHSSDRAIKFNAHFLPEFLAVADKYSLHLMIENVPSAETDPRTNLLMIKNYFRYCGVVFDTRFATCHRNAKETLEDGEIAPAIEHVHVSDYRGGLKEFSCLRPVWHPGEGQCDFGYIFGRLKETGYEGSFTLESPGIVDEGPAINLEKLKESLTFIRESIK